MTARITVNAAAQGLYVVYADGLQAGRISNTNGKGQWFFREEARLADPEYRGVDVSRALHAGGDILSTVIAAAISGEELPADLKRFMATGFRG